jgi:hypothetical protein
MSEARSGPLQNRVTPFGDVVTIAQRGLLTGNRGIIHDPATKTLLRRRWTSTAWIICTCDFKGRRRDVMGGRSWTELFFLDEAIALAAGHRPCFFCRRAAAEAFRAAWASGNGGPVPAATLMDTILHTERLDHGDKRVHPLEESLTSLPNGAVVARDETAFTMVNGRAHAWSEAGYLKPQDLNAADGVLTPPSTLAALRAGYAPMLHPTIASRA